MPRTATPPIDRILARVKLKRPGRACILWPGSIGSHGYGQVSVNGKPELVHRIVYEHFVGPIPPGKHLDHTCHNEDPTCPGGKDCWHRPCCNWRHLEPKTTGENQAAADEPRGRGLFATHCINGHPWSENEAWMVRGTRGGTSKPGKRERYCLACARERMAAR